MVLTMTFKKIIFLKLSTIFDNVIAQSICTHYSCFENMDRFVTLKKIKSKICVSKSRVQKKGRCYPKREEARLLLLFLNNNDPVFCTHNLDHFLKVPDPKKIRST